MKRIRTILIVITLIPVLIWFLLGPGMSLYLRIKSDSISEDILAQSNGYIRIGTISGNFWAGITIEDTIVLADLEINTPPLLTLNEISFKLPITGIFKGGVTPAELKIDGFLVSLTISEDGTIALPDIPLQAFRADRPMLYSGWAGDNNSQTVVQISGENGIVQIHKKFPNLDEMVTISFTNLEGSGTLESDQQLVIESINGDYLSTGINLQGYIPFDPDKQLDFTTTIDNISLAPVFDDFDPLFSGNKFLPDGTAHGEIFVTGQIDQLHISGHAVLENAKLANVLVDTASMYMDYHEGIIELRQIQASGYGGTATASGQIILQSETPMWSAACEFNDVDYPEYLRSNGHYTYEVTGNFSGSMEAQGDFTNADALAVDFEINCPQGTFLSPFSETIMASVAGQVDYSMVTDDDLAEFESLDLRGNIHNQLTEIENFSFMSDALTIESATSIISFDKSISATGEIVVPLEPARDHPRLMDFVRNLPEMFNRVKLEFNITGTLEELIFHADPKGFV